MHKNNQLLVLILAITGVSIAGGLVVLELTHMIPYMILHTAGLILAIFMIATSLLSYMRVGGRRLLYMMLAFMVFGASELLNFSYGVSAINTKANSLNIDTSNIFSLIILGLFTMSVVVKR